MKKKLIIILIICLILFTFREFLIRQYFISKIEYADYDEYILIDYLNGKKNKATYVGADFMIVINYDSDTEEVVGVFEYDYDKRVQYQYNMITENLDKSANNEDRLINLNNTCLLKLLKGKSKFKFNGIDKIDNKICYVFEFRFENDNIITVCLDKEYLYTVKYIEQYSKNDKSENLINNYELDLELKHKDLFKEYIN